MRHLKTAVSSLLFVLLVPLSTVAAEPPANSSTTDRGADSSSSPNLSAFVPSDALLRVTPPALERLNRDRAVRCLQEASASVPAEFGGYVYVSDAADTPDSAPGLAFDETVMRAWTSRTDFDADRGILLIFDANLGDARSVVGRRWSKTAVSEGPSLNGLGIVDTSPADRFCKLVDRVADRVTSTIRSGSAKSVAELRHWVRQAHSQHAKLVRRGSKRQRRARNLAGDDAPLANLVDDRLTDQRFRTLRRELNTIERRIANAPPPDRSGSSTTVDISSVTDRLSEVEGRLRRFASTVSGVGERIAAFETALSAEDELSDRFRDLYERARRRAERDPLWLGADGARNSVDHCGRRINQLEADLAEGAPVSDRVVPELRSCLDRARERVEAASPLSLLAYSILPFAGLTIFFLFGGFRSLQFVRGQLRTRMAVRGDLEALRGRLESLEGEAVGPHRRRVVEAIAIAVRTRLDRVENELNAFSLLNPGAPKRAASLLDEPIDVPADLLDDDGPLGRSPEQLLRWAEHRPETRDGSV